MKPLKQDSTFQFDAKLMTEKTTSSSCKEIQHSCLEDYFNYRSESDHLKSEFEPCLKLSAVTNQKAKVLRLVYMGKVIDFPLNWGVFQNQEKFLKDKFVAIDVNEDEDSLLKVFQAMDSAIYKILISLEGESQYNFIFLRKLA